MKISFIVNELIKFDILKEVCLRLYVPKKRGLFVLKQKGENIMKLSTVLLSSAFILVAGNTYATEVTHPFYVPGQKEVMSDTTYTFNSVDFDDVAKVTDNTLAEKISFGVYKDLAVYVTGENSWTRRNPDRGPVVDEDRNLGWNIGGTYNLLNANNTYVQIDANYGQRENVATVGEYKAVTVALKGGYDFGWAIPYARVIGEFPIAQSKQSLNDPMYDTYIGAYRLFADKVAVDAGVRYKWDKNDDAKDWSIVARADYLFTNKISAGVFGSYMFDGREDDFDSDYDGYTVGVNLKAAF